MSGLTFVEARDEGTVPSGTDPECATVLLDPNCVRTIYSLKPLSLWASASRRTQRYEPAPQQAVNPAPLAWWLPGLPGSAATLRGDVRLCF